MQNALPLIPPNVDVDMPLAALRARHAVLVEQHVAVLLGVWQALSQDNPGENRFLVQKMESSPRGAPWLTALRQMRRSAVTHFDEPGPDDLGECLAALKARVTDHQFDPVLQNLVRNTDRFFGYDLAAVLPMEDSTGFRVVHVAPGEQDHDTEEDCAVNAEGDFWFVQTRCYESHGPRAAFIEPKLYLVGEVDADGRGWRPARLDLTEIYSLIAAVEVIDDLPHGLKSRSFTGAVPLPNFPSGFELQIRESGDSINALLGLSMPSANETKAIDAATSPLIDRQTQLCRQIQELKAQASALRSEIELAQVAAALQFHGLADGMLVTQRSSGNQGVVRLRDRYGVKAVVVPVAEDIPPVPGEPRPKFVDEANYLCAGGLMNQIRLGEWKTAGEDAPQTMRPRER
jgi:hypothetical protein